MARPKSTKKGRKQHPAPAQARSLPGFPPGPPPGFPGGPPSFVPIPELVTVPMPAPGDVVDSLLDVMEDGNEYGSIVSKAMRPEVDITVEMKRAGAAIEAIRGRPCLQYAANLIKRMGNTSIEMADVLPFDEMVGRVPANEKKVDVLLATNGGSAETVNLFVEALRKRFEDVQFIIPSKAMSAGTLWALSGDAIWMDSRANLGPLDPQVPTSDGTFAPAQALLVLVDELRKQGREALGKAHGHAISRETLWEEHRQDAAGARDLVFPLRVAKLVLRQEGARYRDPLTEPTGPP